MLPGIAAASWPALIFALAVAAIGVSGCGGSSGGATTATTNSGLSSATDSGDDQISIRKLVPLLTRYGVGPGQAEVDLTYAPDAFFDITGLARPPEMNSQPSLAFFMQETIHEGELPSEPPQAFLELESGDRVTPYSEQVTAEDPPHHRTTRLLFAQPSDWSAESEQTLTLVVHRGDGAVSAGSVFEWQLPIDLAASAGEGGEG